MRLKTLICLPLLLQGLGQCEAVIAEAIRDSLLQSATEVLLWPVRAAGEILAFVAAELTSAFEDILDSSNAAYELTTAKSSAAAAEFLNTLSPGKQASFMRKVYKGPVPREFFLEPWDAKAETQAIHATSTTIHGFYVAGCVVLGLGFLSLFVFAILSAYRRDQRRQRELKLQKAKEPRNKKKKIRKRQKQRQRTEPKRRQKQATPRRPPQPQRFRRGAEEDEEDDVDERRNGQRAIEEDDVERSPEEEEVEEDHENEEDDEDKENGYDGSEDDEEDEEVDTRGNDSEDQSNTHHDDDEEEDEDKSDSKSEEE